MSTFEALNSFHGRQELKSHISMRPRKNYEKVTKLPGADIGEEGYIPYII